MAAGPGYGCYNAKCILAFRRKYAAFVNSSSGTDHDTINSDDSVSEALAFAELTFFIEGSAENGTFVFKPSNLHELYVSSIRSLLVDKTIHKTRLKNRIIEHYQGNIQEQTDGRNTVLVFKEGMNLMLKDALKSRDYEAEAFTLAKAPKIIRHEIFQTAPGFCFNGEFTPDCQSKSGPVSLKCLVSMIQNSPIIDIQGSDETQAYLNNCAVNTVQCQEESKIHRKGSAPLPE